MKQHKGPLVYIVGLRGQPRYCKIGVTSDIEKRLKQLAAGSPFKAYLFSDFLFSSSTHAFRVETESHAALRNLRVHGEWFKIDPSVAREAIKPIAAQYQ